jgi:hypothetical protein
VSTEDDTIAYAEMRTKKIVGVDTAIAGCISSSSDIPSGIIHRHIANVCAIVDYTVSSAIKKTFNDRLNLFAWSTTVGIQSKALAVGRTIHRKEAYSESTSRIGGRDKYILSLVMACTIVYFGKDRTTRTGAIVDEQGVATVDVKLTQLEKEPKRAATGSDRDCVVSGNITALSTIVMDTHRIGRVIRENLTIRTGIKIDDSQLGIGHAGHKHSHD